MSRISTSEEWFASWFDSPYYHILYKNRNDEEAEAFVEAIATHLTRDLSGSVLDLACGAGRHARSLSRLGFDVTGVDLSKESIEKAKQLPGDIDYHVADMRHFSLDKSFDFVFNLFTSFGYFEDVQDNQLVLQRVVEHMHANSLFVIDYFNSIQVIDNLVPKEEKIIDNIHFHITREVRDGHICKRIQIQDGSIVHEFEEKVQLFSKSELMDLFQKAGLEVKSVFGSYKLEEFSDQNPRLIMIAQKK